MIPVSSRRLLAVCAVLCAGGAGLGAASPAVAQIPNAATDSNKAATTQAAGSNGAAADPARALQWPRGFDATDGTHIELYQPQIDSWNDDRIGGRMAVAAGKPGSDPSYGVVEFSARADVNKPAGLVKLDDFRIERVQVPTAPQEADRLRGMLTARLPQGLVVRLDALQTSYTVAQKLAAASAVPVRNAPPRILFRSSPTLLVLVDGDPVLHDVAGAAGWRRVVNARAMLLTDGTGAYFLGAAGHWYRAGDLAGPWTVLAQPSTALVAAAKAAARAAKPDPMLPRDGKPAAQPPAIDVSTVPAELVMTAGKPVFRPVEGTSLLAVSNADHAVFMDPADNRYYVLLSGRWFAAPALDGTWEFVDGKNMPAEFAHIDAHDPQAGVLASVPGTPQAKEAVIASTIPQTAAVSRAKATLSVEYLGGAPVFQAIPGTAVEFAANTMVPVFHVDGRYYALSRAVWFVSASLRGPWRVADAVPTSIYEIPVNSPYHYVTYVRVYSANAETVVFGYTPGYMGVVVGPDGTVVYGTGYVYPSYVAGSVWVGYPPTYGYNAAFDTAAGFAFGFAAAQVWGSPAPYWGPYWGAPYWRGVDVNTVDVYGQWGGSGTVTHAAGWNGWNGTQWQGTHAEGYNPATGASFKGTAGSAYNPWTGNAAAGYRGAYANPATGVAGAGRGGAVSDADGDWAAGHQGVHTNANTGRTVASSTGATGTDGHVNSVNSRGVSHNANTGNTVGWNNGNVYGDHDGNVYRRTDSGWEQHTSSGWQAVSPSGNGTSQYLNGQQGARAATQPGNGNRLQGGTQSAQWGNRDFNGGGMSGWSRDGRAGGGGFRGGFGRR